MRRPCSGRLPKVILKAHSLNRLPSQSALAPFILKAQSFQLSDGGAGRVLLIYFAGTDGAQGTQQRPKLLLGCVILSLARCCS